MDRPRSTASAGEFRTTHDWDGDTSLTRTIVKAVAAIKNVEVTDLEPLQTAVDTDALEQLMTSVEGSASQDRKRSAEFTFDGCNVVVTSSGDITIERNNDEVTNSVVSTEQDFQTALCRLIREAEAAEVVVEGGWVCRDGPVSRTWGIEIYEVDDSGSR